MLRAVTNAAEKQMAISSYSVIDDTKAVAESVSTSTGRAKRSHTDGCLRQFDLVLIDALLGEEETARRLRRETLKLERAMTGVLPAAMSPQGDDKNIPSPPSHHTMNNPATQAEDLLKEIRDIFGEGGFPVAINRFEEEEGEYSSNSNAAETDSEPGFEVVYGATNGICNAERVS